MRLINQEHFLLLLWMVLTGLIIFGLVVSWNEGLIAALIYGDRSRICLVIALLYLFGTLHCARRVVYLSSELNAAARVADIVTRAGGSGPLRYDGERILVGDNIALPDCEVSRHLADIVTSSNVEAYSESSNLTEAFAEHLKGSHEGGWFVVDILLKLGLVGTIIGFILMLGSVADTSSLDVNTMQKVLKQMSSGMGTALFTTLSGLIGSMLLGMQYLMADKGADELVRRTVRIAETQTPSISWSTRGI